MNMVAKNSTASPAAAYMSIHLLAQPMPMNRPHSASGVSVFLRPSLKKLICMYLNMNRYITIMKNTP